MNAQERQQAFEASFARIRAKIAADKAAREARMEKAAEETVIQMREQDAAAEKERIRRYDRAAWDAAVEEGERRWK